MGPGKRKRDTRRGDEATPLAHRRARGRGASAKVRKVTANNRKRSFEVDTDRGNYTFPFALLERPPRADNRITRVYPDPELGDEGFTVVLEDGSEDTIHVDAVLDHNEDPAFLRDLLLYRLTLEARDRVAASPLSKREIIRRLGTSAPQLYRLLDQTNYTKSIGEVVRLLYVVGCDVDLVVRERRKRRA